MLLAPGGQRREEAAINVSRVRSDMPTDLFEIDGREAACIRRNSVEPSAEAQIAHAAAIVAARSKRHGPAFDPAARKLHGPASGRAEVERENGRPAAINRSFGQIGSRRRRQVGGDVHNEGSRKEGLRLWSAETLRRWSHADQAKKIGSSEKTRARSRLSPLAATSTTSIVRW